MKTASGVTNAIRFLALTLLGAAGCASAESRRIVPVEWGIVLAAPHGVLTETRSPGRFQYVAGDLVLTFVDGELRLNGVSHGWVEPGDLVELDGSGEIAVNGSPRPPVNPPADEEE